MPKTAVYFDRDNTLIVSDGYLGDPDSVRLMPGAAHAVARARELGYAVVVVSNQSGVARGLFPESAVRAVNARVEQMLRSSHPGALIDRQEYCPFHPSAAVPQYRMESDLRKPAPGMFLKARADLGLADGGWCVGDAPRDIAAGKAAGCRTILFRPVGVVASPAADEPSDVVADFVVTSLQEAMDVIERNTPTPSSDADPASPAETTASPSEPPDAARPTDEPPVRNATPSPAPASPKSEKLLEQLLVELRRANEVRPADFSVAKLLAGLVQVLALAVLFLSYLRGDGTQTMLLLAVFMQMLVASLLLMAQTK
jgi:D-glycero-D-manno-heptose 1,7-bisphosphate phosphatase